MSKKQQTSEKPESIPRVELLRYCLEEKLSALRENRPIAEEVLRFLSLSERYFSGLLEMLHKRLLDEHIDNFIQKAELTPKEREVAQLRRESPDLTAKQAGERLGRAEGSIKATYYLTLRKFRRIQSPYDEAFNENIANGVKVINFFAQECLRHLRQEQPHLLIPRGFTEKRKQAYEVEKELVSRKASFEAAFAKMIEEPIISLFELLSSVVWSQRLYLRYLRSRFGMKGTSSRQLALKQTRAAEAKHTFQSWRRRNRKKGFSEAEIQADYRAWRKELIYESALFSYAKERLIEAQTLQEIWQNAIYLSFTSLCEKHGDVHFDLKEFATDVLIGMKRSIKEFRLVYDTTKLDMKREFSYDYENELARLSGWAEANLSPDHNPRLAKAIEIEGKRTISDWIPGSILLSLDDDNRKENEPFYSGSGETSLLSRIARKLEIANKELPLEMEPESIIDSRAEDFTLREEARHDIALAISKSGLTPSEREVFVLDLQELTDKETAERLDKPIGTVKPLLYKARKKIKHILEQR